MRIRRRQRRLALPAGHVEQHAAPHERRHRFDAQAGEAGRRLGRIGRDAAEQRQVVRLVAEGIDMGPGMFHHGQHAGGAAARAVSSGR